MGSKASQLKLGAPSIPRSSRNAWETSIPIPTGLYTDILSDMKPTELEAAKLEQRRIAMMAIVGIWKDRTDLPDTETYIRNLRDGTRLERLLAQWRADGD